MTYQDYSNYKTIACTYLTCCQMTGVIALAIEHFANDVYCLNITQADIIQTPYRLTRERRFSDDHKFRFVDAIFESSSVTIYYTHIN